MTATVLELHGVRILACAPAGPKLQSERDAADLIGEALGHGARLVLIPAERLSDDFFQLKTRLAGEFAQKFVNYTLRLAIAGDISRHLGASAALTAFVTESNRGAHLWFVADMDDLATRLERMR